MKKLFVIALLKMMILEASADHNDDCNSFYSGISISFNRPRSFNSSEQFRMARRENNDLFPHSVNLNDPNRATYQLSPLDVDKSSGETYLHTPISDQFNGVNHDVSEKLSNKHELENSNKEQKERKNIDMKMSHENPTQETFKKTRDIGIQVNQQGDIKNDALNKTLRHVEIQDKRKKTTCCC